MPKNEELNEIVREIKYKYNLTQGGIADKIGVSFRYFSNVLNGHYPFTKDMKEKIYRTFTDIEIEDSKIMNEELMKIIGKIKYQYNLTQTQISKNLGVSRQYLSDVLNGRYPFSDGLKSKLLICFPEIGMESPYNIGSEGKGKIDDDNPIMSYTTGKPYYNVDFEMGYDELMNDQTVNPDFLIDFRPYNKCDMWCNARGDSMRPTISSGDIIALKEIKDTRYIISNEIYAIVTANGLRTIKRMIDNGDKYTLVPDNKEYPEQDIDKSIVTRLFLVIGTMKMF